MLHSEKSKINSNQSEIHSENQQFILQKGNQQFMMHSNQQFIYPSNIKSTTVTTNVHSKDKTTQGKSFS